MRAASATGLMVPVALEAYPTATRRVFFVTWRARASALHVQSAGSKSTHRTVQSRSRAARSHGETFAS